MGYPSTFKDIQDSVIAKGRLDDTLDTQRVKDWINQVYAQACVETEFLATSETLATPLIAEQTHADIPDTINKIDYITPVGTDGTLWGPMEMVTLEQVLSQQAYASGVAMTTGAPSLYAFTSPKGINFWPAASGGEQLRFYGTTVPPPLVADTDVPVFPEPYASNVLEYGTLSQAAEFKRDIFVLDFWNQMFDQSMQMFRGWINTRVGDKTQQFTIGSTRPWPRSNSTDSPYNY